MFFKKRNPSSHSFCFDEPISNDIKSKDQQTIIIIYITIFLLIFFVWTRFGKVDEVAVGPGQVIPTLRDQKIQSLDGGILSNLYVHEGQIVEKGMILAQLDPSRAESALNEAEARYYSALAARARLYAEANQLEQPNFPADLDQYPDLINAEKLLFLARKNNLVDTIAGLNHATNLIKKEISITQSLLLSGAASQVDLIKKQRDLNDIELKIIEAKSNYVVRSGEDLAKIDAEIKSLKPIINGRNDAFKKLTIISPVKGIVKSIEVTTIGGVVAPNGLLMNIIPINDKLLVEARISPRDIAFIRTGLDALIKVTAYDYSIYGALQGKVETISPDTIRDEIKPENLYYRVFIRTNSDVLKNSKGENFFIGPGMITSSSIKTGNKTIWEYLTKPFNKLNESFHER